MLSQRSLRLSSFLFILFSLVCSAAVNSSNTLCSVVLLNLQICNHMEWIFLNLFLISTHHYVLRIIHGIVWGYSLFSFSCVHIVLLATVPKFIYPLCWWTFALFPVFVHCLYTHSLIYASTINTFVSVFPSAHVQDFLGVELQPCMHTYFVSPGNAKLFSKMVIQIYTPITTDESSFGSTSS